MHKCESRSIYRFTDEIKITSYYLIYMTITRTLADITYQPQKLKERSAWIKVKCKVLMHWHVQKKKDAGAVNIASYTKLVHNTHIAQLPANE